MIRARVPHAETVGQDFSFRPFFREAVRTQRPYVSGVYTSRAAQRTVVTIAVPVADGRGGVAGVLCGALSVARLSEFLVGAGGSQAARVSVFDREGALVADSRGASTVRPVPLADRPIVQAALAGRTGAMEFQEPGTSEVMLGVHVPIAVLGWGVVVARPAAAVYASTTLKGYTVLEAAAPDDALRLSRAHVGPLHLLITDVVMPGMSGLELSVRLRAERESLKVLCMSGYPEHPTMQGGAIVPDIRWLQKPFTPDRLSERVRQVLDTPAD